MADVTVLIADKALSDLVSCELEGLGYSVDRSGGECTVLITDADASPASLPRHVFSIGISRDPEKADPAGFSAVLRRPVLLSELRDTVSPLISDGRGNAPGGEIRPILLSPASKQALWLGKLIKLSENEFRILSYLCENRGRPVSRGELNSLLGGGGNLADVYVCHLRSKLSSNGTDPIKTLRGEGYILRF